jgi:hypothetical protein
MFLLIIGKRKQYYLEDIILDTSHSTNEVLRKLEFKQET